MYLGIDYGKKRIGLALGQIFPKGAGVIVNRNEEQVLRELSSICDENEVEKIIVGLPTRAGGEKGTLDEEVRAFAEKVQKETGLLVVLEPETFTSVQAEQIFREQNKNFTKESGKVDELAAILILEQYIKESKKQ